MNMKTLIGHGDKDNQYLLADTVFMAFNSREERHAFSVPCCFRTVALLNRLKSNTSIEPFLLYNFNDCNTTHSTLNEVQLLS